MAVLVTTGLVLSGVLAGSSTSSPRRAVAPVKVTLGYFPATVQTFYANVAQSKGFFQKENLDVNLVAIASGPNLAAALLSGSTDISDEGLAIIGPLMYSQQPIVTLLGNILLNYGLVVRPNVSTPNSSRAFPAPIKDLKGLKIAITVRGSLTENFVNRLLDAAGLSPSDVTYISAGTPLAIVAAFQSGSVDAAVTFPPVAQLLGTPGKDYKVVADVPSAKNVGNLFPGYLVDVWASTRGWIDKNRAAATGFCRAMIHAATWANDPQNLDEVASLLGTWVALPTDQAKPLWQQYKGTFLQHITPRGWGLQQKFALSGGAVAYEQGVDSQCLALFAAKTLSASVGPGASIAVRGTAHIAAGRVVITVKDASKVDNFRLTGPGVSKATGKVFRGTVKWALTLKPGTYTFRSDRPKGPRGKFTVATG